MPGCGQQAGQSPSDYCALRHFSSCWISCSSRSSSWLTCHCCRISSRSMPFSRQPWRRAFSWAGLASRGRRLAGGARAFPPWRAGPFSLCGLCHTRWSCPDAYRYDRAKEILKIPKRQGDHFWGQGQSHFAGVDDIAFCGTFSQILSKGCDILGYRPFIN
jgi:hypothetical protein